MCYFGVVDHTILPNFLFYSQNMKLVQSLFKNYVDFVVGADHPFEKKRLVFHSMATDCRHMLSSLKWMYQLNAIHKAVSSWGNVVSARECLKVMTAACVCVEQFNGDLQMVQKKWKHDMSLVWVDFVFTVAKFFGNVLSFVDDFTQYRAKACRLAKGDVAVATAEKLSEDIRRHKLAIIRQIADISIYACWIDNWKRTVTPRFLNVCGLVSSLLGVYEVYTPHTHTQLESL